MAVRTSGRHTVNRLISAAQVFTHLVTIGHQTEPEHERQVPPLVGQTAEQAQKAWERAIEKAGGRKITARLVNAAVQELQPPGGAKPVASQPHQNKAEQRKWIDGAIGELLWWRETKGQPPGLDSKGGGPARADPIPVPEAQLQSITAWPGLNREALWFGPDKST